MRLLEFNKDDSGANPRRSPAKSAPAKPARKTPPVRRAKTGGLTPPGSGKVFPAAGGGLIRPARNGPVDLEQLQSRIDFLENRLQSQSERLDTLATARELETLKDHVQRLEHNVETELRASRERENTMLELARRPTLKVTIRNRFTQFRQSDLPAAVRWIRHVLRLWWKDVQPEWWPRFARAWQESLDKARR